MNCRRSAGCRVSSGNRTGGLPGRKGGREVRSVPRYEQGEDRAQVRRRRRELPRLQTLIAAARFLWFRCVKSNRSEVQKSNATPEFRFPRAENAATYVQSFAYSGVPIPAARN